jgi:transposase
VPFRLINPVTTKQFTRATVRKKKTDTTDAEVIARVAARGEGAPVTSATFAPMKSMVCAGVKLVNFRKALTLMELKRQLESIPGVGAIVSDTLLAEIGDIARFR